MAEPIIYFPPSGGLNINGLTEDTAPDVFNDFFPEYDASASINKKVKLVNAHKNLPSFSATRLSVNQTVASNTATKVQLTTEDYDLAGNFDPVTNFRFTAPVDGVYHFDGSVRISTAAAIVAFASLFKNGANIRNMITQQLDGGDVQIAISIDVKLLATDYIELYVQHNSGSSKSIIAGTDVYLTGHLVATT